MGLLDILTGWVPINPNTELKAGDVIRTIDGIERTGLLSVKDSDVIGAIYSVSDKEFTDAVRNATGAEIEILRRDVTIEESGRKWDHIYEYKINKSSPIAPFVVAVTIKWLIIAAVALIAYLYTVNVVTKATMIQTPAGKVSIFGLLFAAVIAIVAIVLIKTMLGGKS